MADKTITLEQFKEALKAIRNSTISVPDLSVKFVENAPNWNAAEGEPGYIQGRTHWSELSVVDIFKDLEVSEFEEGAGQGMLPGSYDIEAGRKCTVTYNGAEYVCTSSLFTVDGMDVGIAIGNLDAANGVGDSGEPFVLMFMLPEFIETVGFANAIMFLDGSSSAVISLSGEMEVVHALDKKYIAKDILSDLIPVIDLSHYSLTPVELGEKITVSLDEDTANKLKSDLSIGIAKVRFTRMDQSTEVLFEVTGWVQHITQGLISAYSFLSDYSISGLKVYLCLTDNGTNVALEVKISV